MRTRRVLWAVVLCGISVAQADTTWVAGGTVSGLWSPVNSPYVIQGDIEIPADGALTILSGVEVLFDGAWRVIVPGELVALGMEGDSIRFGAFAGNGHWLGFLFQPGSVLSRFEYCVIEHTGYQTTGALRCEGAVLDVKHTAFRNSRPGGHRVLLADNAAVVTFSDCEMTGDTTYYSICGGGFAIQNGSFVVLERCVISSYRSLDGGAFCPYDSHLKLIDCVLKDHRAQIWGGAMFLDAHSTLVAIRCAFWNNRGRFGGAINSATQDTLTLDHCLFAGNQAESAMGTGQWGAIEANDATVTISHCTIVDNASAPSSWALFAGGHAKITNTIVAHQRQGGGIRFQGAGNELENSLVYGNPGPEITGWSRDGTGVVDRVNLNSDSCDRYANLFLDPLFVDTSEHDYRLLDNSPAIDAGDSSLEWDLDGTPPDLGVYAVFQETAVQPATPVPAEFRVEPAYPNPFNAETSTVLSLPQSQHLVIELYDLLGRVALTVADAEFAAGRHRLTVDGAALSSGIYLLHVSAEMQSSTQKLVLLK